MQKWYKGGGMHKGVIIDFPYRSPIRAREWGFLLQTMQQGTELPTNGLNLDGITEVEGGEKYAVRDL